MFFIRIFLGINILLIFRRFYNVEKEFINLE